MSYEQVQNKIRSGTLVHVQSQVFYRGVIAYINTRGPCKYNMPFAPRVEDAYFDSITSEASCSSPAVVCCGSLGDSTWLVFWLIIKRAFPPGLRQQGMHRHTAQYMQFIQGRG